MVVVVRAFVGGRDFFFFFFGGEVEEEEVEWVVGRGKGRENHSGRL